MTKLSYKIVMALCLYVSGDLKDSKREKLWFYAIENYAYLISYKELGLKFMYCSFA